MNNPGLIASLDSFRPISLEDIDSVRLMNRVETKYLLSVKKAEDLIKLLADKYLILEINRLRAFKYHTKYMDTSDYHFYNQHVRGEYERHKVRFRKYDITGISYLEIKKKTNTRRTIKQRIINDISTGTFDQNAVNFISEYSPVSYTLLRPVLISTYTRVTAVRPDSKERITLDFNISFSGINVDKQVEIPYLVIAELKSEDFKNSTPFKSILKNLNIYPSGFSKYCTGSAMLNASLKQNMVKPKLILINKLKDEQSGNHNFRSD